jgi:hypothetical protein
MKHWLTPDDETQNKLVLAWLRKYDGITSIEAIRTYGITRIASIIHRLKRQGHNITSEVIFDSQNKSIHWSKYRLIK